MKWKWQDEKQKKKRKQSLQKGTIRGISKYFMVVSFSEGDNFIIRQLKQRYYPTDEEYRTENISLLFWVIILILGNLGAVNRIR